MTSSYYSRYSEVKGDKRGGDPQLIMAASVMMIVPSIILFFVAQKALMRGVVVSGVKG